MKVGVLTSSRADFGIYLPLLHKLESSPDFELEIICFGMHLQESQGYTYKQIIKEGFTVIHKVGSMPENDFVINTVEGYGQLIVDFAQFWEQHRFDLVFALGDRWEMSAAVQSSIPFEIRLAHIHGGETTLGAIDNIYRHQITLASLLHFTAAEGFSRKVSDLIGSKKNIFTVGSISLEELDSLKLPSWESVKEQYQIPFDQFILVTIHPESVDSNRNELLSKIAYDTLELIMNDSNILITQANSDSLGALFNKKFSKLQGKHPDKVCLVSSLGKLNYFSAIKSCKFMLGNTSSGIIESASFKKWVINIGDRQKGRLRNENIIDTEFNLASITQALNEVVQKPEFEGENLYYRPNTTSEILTQIKLGERF